MSYPPPPPPTTHHPPETFWRVLGIVGGQDLVCGLPIVQGTSAHSFDPPSKFFGHKTLFGPENFLDPNFVLDPKIFLDPKFFGQIQT